MMSTTQLSSTKASASHEQGNSENALSWPPRLLEILRTHMQSVEHPQYAAVPPIFHNVTITVYDFLTLRKMEIVDKCVEKCGKEERAETIELVEYTVELLLELLEQVCGQGFLMNKERRLINMAVLQREKRVLGSIKLNAVTKRRRLEEMDGVLGGARYSRVLPLEYLLRLIAALPMVIDHYDKLGDSMMPPYAQTPLWTVMQVILQLLDAEADRFYPLSAYIPLKEHQILVQ